MYNMYVKSVIAGMAIALGGWIYLSTANPIIGAILFVCGLLAVRTYGLNLFTGKVQYMVTKEYHWYDYIVILIGNFLGVLLMAAISRATVSDVASKIALAKATQPLFISLVKGTGCGMLMSLATYKKSPLWMCIPCVAAFIIAGFNHCIADFYYACVGGTLSWSFLMTIIGNIFGGIMFSNLIYNEQT